MPVFDKATYGSMAEQWVEQHLAQMEGPTEITHYVVEGTLVFADNSYVVLTRDAQGTAQVRALGANSDGPMPE